jgi:hypothetical protein
MPNLPVTYTTQANKPYVIRSLRDVVGLFGNKNVAYTALDIALCACTGTGAELTVIALPNPVANIKSEYDFIISGTATAAHTKSLRFLTYDGTKSVSISIPNGANIAAQAALYKAAFDSLPNVPFSVTVTATGLKIIFNDAGIYGEGLLFNITDSRESSQAITDNNVTLAQTITGSGSLDLAGYKEVLGRCCFQCVYSADNSPATIEDIQAWGESKGTCFVSSCFQSLYWGAKGLVSVLSNFGNTGAAGQPYNRRNVGLALETTSLLLSWMFSAGRAALSCCNGCSTPTNPLQNEASRISCLPATSSCYKGWSDEDYKELWEAGWTPVEAINGLYGIRKEQYFSRFGEDGNRDYNLSDPTVYRMLTQFNIIFTGALYAEYNSTFVFKNGTAIAPIQSISGQTLPDWFSTVRGTTPENIKGYIVATLNKLVGRFLDAQDFEKIVYVFTDDVMRGCTEGNPRIIYPILDKIRFARPIQQFRSLTQFTTSFC